MNYTHHLQELSKEQDLLELQQKLDRESVYLKQIPFARSFCWANDYNCIQLRNSRIDTHLFCASVEMEVMEFRIRIADKIKLKLMKYTIEKSTILRENCDFLLSQNFLVAI